MARPLPSNGEPQGCLRVQLVPRAAPGDLHIVMGPANGVAEMCFGCKVAPCLLHVAGTRLLAVRTPTENGALVSAKDNVHGNPGNHAN